MADVGCDVIFLAGRLTGRDDVRGLKALIERLERLGHTARVICLRSIPDHSLPNLAECPGLGRRWRIPWAARSLGPLEEADRPRMIHVLNASMAEASLELAERWQLPYLLTIDEFPEPSGRLRLSRNWCRGLISTNAELTTSLTREMAVPAALIQTLPRSIAEVEGLPFPRGTGRVPVIGAAGEMVAGSGFATFLNAARKVVDAGVDAEFLLSGEGVDEGDLRRKADRLGIADRLTFADEMAIGLTFWDVLDVYCQTSVVPNVGRPLALAMAHGVPSIATDVDGLRVLIEPDRTGIRVPSGEASPLARAILGLLRDHDRARALGQAGQQAVVRDHNPDHEARQLDTLYRQVARSSRSSDLSSRYFAPATTKAGRLDDDPAFDGSTKLAPEG